MAISLPNGPAGGRDIVATAMAARLHHAPHLPVLKGNVQTGRPLPVYLLDVAGAAQPAPLRAARLVGWRYPVVGDGDATGLAFLRDGPDGPRFAGLAHGALSERLMQAATLAENTLKTQPENYEPRLLEIPALHLCVLWLACDTNQDLFVPVLDSSHGAAGVMQIERDITPRITAALARIKAPAAAPIPSTQGVQRADPSTVGWALAALWVAVPLLPPVSPWFHTSPLKAWLLELALTGIGMAVLGNARKGYWFGILVDGRNRISLSRLQIVAWTILFSASFATILSWNDLTVAAGTLGSLNVPPAAWLLMGMSGVSAAATPIILSAKPDPGPAAPASTPPQDPTKFVDGVVVKRKPGAKPSWWDILLGDDAGNADTIDISKVQQLLLSATAILAYSVAIARILWATDAGHNVGTLPDMPDGFLTLIGASHATYLTYKAASHSN